MTAAITEHDTAGATSNHYHFTRVVETGGRTVRVRIERNVDRDQSLAVAEVLNTHLTWTNLADDAQGNWWHTTPTPHPHVDAAALLGPLADRLLYRAAQILAPSSTTPSLSPRVLDAVSALLASTHGYNGERRIEPDEIAWANTPGGTLHIIEHADGSVTFTKEHLDACPFITSAGTQDCDQDCYFEHPADRKQRLGT
jgi:hypothetical protein